MNNYNELRNKPTINNQELMGNFNLPVVPEERLLPDKTDTNLHKGAGLIFNGTSWTGAETEQGISLNRKKWIGYVADYSTNPVTYTKLWKLDLMLSSSDIYNNNIIDLSGNNMLKDCTAVYKIEGTLHNSEHSCTPLNFTSSNNYYCKVYCYFGDTDYNDGKPCLNLEVSDAVASENDGALITIYFTKQES